MSSTFIDHMSVHTLADPTTNNTILKEQEQEQQEQQQQDPLNVDMRNCSISSTGSNIDISGRLVSSDILVALLDRPNEMRQLAIRNNQFYEAIENYITETQGNFAWQRFQDIVYKPREKLPDRAWIHQISHFLGHNPVFFSKFKESVGYEDENEEHNTSISPPPQPQPPHKLTHSTSTGSSTGGNGRRRSRRLSSISFGNNDTLVDNHHGDDLILEEEAPKVPEGMFADEDQFYHQQFSGGRRRRSSYHLIQSEPHPTFVDSKIEEEEEAEVGQRMSGGEESDHLADLLDNSSSDEDDDEEGKRRLKELGLRGGDSSFSTRHNSNRDMDLIRLRDYPEFQANLPKTHAEFFRKAQQLLSMAPSSRRFSATIRRNSILEDANMPPSPVTELDEPRFCCTEGQEDVDNDGSGGNLANLICCTRRQQPDDIAWLNGVMEALSGWPELVDRLHDIINESLED